MTANTNVKVTAQGVNNTGPALDGARKSLKQLRSEQFAMGRQMKSNRRQFQQAGMQISDFAIQVGGGQSAILAFTQNAPQFVQSFGAIGGALSAIISIGGVAVLMWWNQKKAADAAKNSMMSLSKAYKALGEAAGDYVNKIAMLKFGVDTEAEVVALKERIRLTNELKKAQVSRDKAVASGFGGALAQRIVNKLQRQLDANKDILATLKEQRDNYDFIVAKNKQMQALQLAHAKIQGDAIRERDALIKRSHAAQLEVMGRTQQVAISQLNNLMDGYREYYRSRIQGEIMVQQAIADYAKGVGRGRGNGDLENNSQLNIYRRQLERDAKLRAMFEEKALAGANKTKKAVKDTMDMFKELDDVVKDLNDSLGRTLATNLTAMVDGTKSVTEAFRSMARDIIAKLFEVIVVQRTVANLSKLLGLGGGGAVSGFFSGTSASAPSAAPSISSISAAIPSRAGVSSAQPMTVIQHNTFTSDVKASVRDEIAAAAPRLTEAAKTAVMDARRRGGSMAAAFG